MAEPHPRIAAVLVNYHKASRVLESVESLMRQTIADRMDIIVVDNSDDAGEATILQDGLAGKACELMIAPTNLGYTRGVNLGAASMAAGSHVLLVNPDIVLDSDDSVAALIDRLEADSAIGVLAAMQVTDDGEIVEIARRFPNLPRLILRRLMPGKLTDHYLLSPLLETSSPAQIDVDWVQSSFTLVRNSLWHSTQGLDEFYHIFMADTVLGLDANRLGYRVSVSSHATVRADGLRASRGGLRAFFKSRVLRIHLLDAIKYELAPLLAPFRRRHLRDSLAGLRRHDVPGFATGKTSG